MNAAHTSGVFVFAARALNFFENFLSRSLHSELGCEIGQIHAIRLYRMTQRRGRKMLRRIIDRRWAENRGAHQSRSMSITTHDEQVESCAEFARAPFALTTKSV
jgi:hypothetical protein